MLQGVVHVGLLARADAAVNLRDETARQHLEQDHACSRIEHLQEQCFYRECGCGESEKFKRDDH